MCAYEQGGADTHAGHSHGGADGHSHGHSHSHGSEPAVPAGMQPLLSTVPRPACGCGYADVEEMKRAAEAAAQKPQLSAEEKTQRKVAAVHATREHGKQLYLEGKYAEAFAVYERGVLIASGIYDVDETLQAQLTALEVLLDVNMAQCQLKLGQWKAATDQARMALQLDPHCAKAHFRMAQAYVGLGEYDEAKKCLSLCTAADTAGATRREVAALQSDIRRREIDEREKLHKFTKQLEAKMAKEKTFGGAVEQTTEGAAPAANSDSATAAAAQPDFHLAVPSSAAPSSSSTAAATTATAAPSDPDSDLSDLTQSLRTAQLHGKGSFHSPF